MIRSRLSLASLYLKFAMLLLPACAYFIAVHLRFGFNVFFARNPVAGLPSYWGILLLTTIIWAVTAEESGLWSVEGLYAVGGKSRRLLEALACTYGIVMVAGFLDRRASYSRLVIGISAIALFILATITRVIFRASFELLRKDCRNEVRILVVGADGFARRVGASLMHGEVLPCRVMGFVRLPDQEVAVEGPVYELDQIPAFSNGNAINDIVIAVPAVRLSEIRKIAPTLKKVCVPTRVVIDLGEEINLRDQLINLGGFQMLDLRPSLAETGSYLLEKRIFDVAFSLFVLLVTFPLTVIIAAIIKAEDRGPAFFVQDRVGLNGQIFQMFKFRTMNVGSHEEGDTRWTSSHDTRRTRVGAFLRKTNLDELPQFLNVLKGDMSVVGPRPERPFFVNRFLEEVDRYNSRHLFKAGITGWAQVNGWRGDTSIAKRVEYDLYYLRNWSLTLDLQIITMTVFRIFNSKNAY